MPVLAQETGEYRVVINGRTPLSFALPMRVRCISTKHRSAYPRFTYGKRPSKGASTAAEIGNQLKSLL
jgi:hypothetical protein